MARGIRGRRLTTASVGILAVGMALGAAAKVAVPALARQALERELSAALGREVRIAGLEVGVLARRLSITGLHVAGARGASPLAWVPRLRADFEVAASLIERAVVVRELRVERPVVRLARAAAGRSDADDIAGALGAWREAGSGGRRALRFSISNIQIEGGRLELDDRVSGERHLVTDVRAAIPFLANAPSPVEPFVRPHLSARVDGRPVEVLTIEQITPGARELEAGLHLTKL